MFSMFKRINGALLFLFLWYFLPVCYESLNAEFEFAMIFSQGACCWLVQYWSKIAGE